MTEYEAFVRAMCTKFGSPHEAERLLTMDKDSALKLLEGWVALAQVAEQAMREFRARDNGIYINRAPRSRKGAIG